MMGGYKGAMNEVKWQGLKLCEDVQRRMKCRRFVATLRCSRVGVDIWGSAKNKSSGCQELLFEGPISDVV